MKMIVLFAMILLPGCTAISFSTKDGYRTKGISGFAIYPDVGGVVTGFWDRMIKKEKTK